MAERTEIRSFLIVLMLFSGVVVGMSLFYIDLTSPTNLASYGLTPGQIANISPDDLSSRDVSEDITTKTKEIEDALRQQPTGITAVDVAWGYINAALNAITLPFTAISLFSAMIADASVAIGLPSWVGGVVLGVIIIIMVFAVMSSYLKWPV